MYAQLDKGATTSEMSSTAGEGAAASRAAMGGAHSARGKQAAAVGRCEEAGCGASLASWAQYVQHLQAQHGYDFARFCDICLKDMELNRLDYHRRLHFNENWPRRVECQRCDAKFFSAAAYEEHVRGFHGGRAAEQ